METSRRSGVIYTKEKREMKFENPFTLKIGQVFTGFGIGCGIGIGVGRPLNLGSIPVLNQVMAATRGATDAFSGVQRHVNGSLRRMGSKNIEAGVGCGIGFGHGFGVGLAVKPGVVHQIQSHLFQAVTHVMDKLGIASNLPVNQGILPASLQTGTVGNSVQQLIKSVSDSEYQDNVRDGITSISSEDSLAPKTAAVSTQYGSRTEMAINNFLKNPLLKEESRLLEQAGSLQLENNMLQMVLKHQLLIEELMQENEKLRQILVEELKVEPSKLQSSFTSGIERGAGGEDTGVGPNDGPVDGPIGGAGGDASITGGLLGAILGDLAGGFPGAIFGGATGGDPPIGGILGTVIPAGGVAIINGGAAIAVGGIVGDSIGA